MNEPGAKVSLRNIFSAMLTFASIPARGDEDTGERWEGGDRGNIARNL